MGVVQPPIGTDGRCCASSSQGCARGQQFRSFAETVFKWVVAVVARTVRCESTEQGQHYCRTIYIIWGICSMYSLVGQAGLWCMVYTYTLSPLGVVHGLHAPNVQAMGHTSKKLVLVYVPRASRSRSLGVACPTAVCTSSMYSLVGQVWWKVYTCNPLGVVHGLYAICTLRTLYGVTPMYHCQQVSACSMHSMHHPLGQCDRCVTFSWGRLLTRRTAPWNQRFVSSNDS